MTTAERIAGATLLAADEGLSHDIAQIAAHNTLSALAPSQVRRVNWNFSTSRVIRNVSAISLALQEVARDSPDHIAEQDRQSLFAAQIWERLATYSGIRGADNRARLLNSAINYDLAGYQANAICLARQSAEVRVDDEVDPLYLAALLVQRKFLELSELAGNIRNEPEASALEELTFDGMVARAATATMAGGLVEAASYFLSGEKAALDSAALTLERASTGFAAVGLGTEFALTQAIRRSLPISAQRSVWTHLGEALPGNLRWRRYIHALARGTSQDILHGHSISELWPSQVRAIEAGLLSSRQSFVVRMPTSAGKTRVAEMSIVHTIASDPQARCIYIAPYRALASEIQLGLENLFADLGYAATTVPGTFEQDSLGSLLASSDELLILTPEKLDLLLRLQPEVLEKLRLVVVDEGHVLGEVGRGPKVELLLTRLRRIAPDARFLFMSAVVPRQTLEQLAEWLGGSADSIAVTGWRPSVQRFARLEWLNGQGTLRYSRADTEEEGLAFVPRIVERREYSYVHPDTNHRRRPRFPDNKGQVAAELAYLFVQQGPVLIYCAHTQWAQSVAREVLERVSLAELTNVATPHSLRQRRTRSLAVAVEWLGSEHELVRMLERGIAFHHGRLPEAVRAAIEQDVREKHIEVLVATNTLAQGVNLPFKTVIFHSANRFDEVRNEMTRLPARDYWNIAGRAGRAGQETEGLVIHIVQGRNDLSDFNYFEEHRHSVELLDSALLVLLRDLISRRISSEDAQRRLDSDLLALLVEEDDSILDLAVLQEALGSSLFALQANQEGLDAEPLISVIHDGVRSIASRVDDLELRRVYASTGMSSWSCDEIAGHVRGNSDALTALLAGNNVDRGSALELMLDGIVGLREMVSNTPDIGGLMAPLDMWMDGLPVAEISATLRADPFDVTRVVEDLYAYRFPWGLAGYIRIASFILHLDPISPLFTDFPSMVKYGVPTQEAAWAMTAGVSPRRAAIDLAAWYMGDVAVSSATEFRRWLGTLDPELLNEEFGLTGPALEATARAVFRSGTNPYLMSMDRGEDFLPLEAEVRAIRQAIVRGAIARLATDDSLTLKRDFDSAVNRNAVLMMKDDTAIGYLPWAAAQAIATELDVGIDLVGTVQAISTSRTGFVVQVKVSRRS